MALTRYKRTLRTGGTSDALDGIDGANLVDGDMAEVWQSDNVLRFYHLDADSGASESDPAVIAPDTNPGTKRWILQTVTP